LGAGHLVLEGSWLPHRNDYSGVAAGAVCLLSGALASSLDLSAANARITGADGGNLAGSSVVGGDVDRDGFADLLQGRK